MSNKSYSQLNQEIRELKAKIEFEKNSNKIIDELKHEVKVLKMSLIALISFSILIVVFYAIFS